jgi:hypothetical protein
MVVLLNIRGNCSHLEAKPAHLVGHLPAIAEGWKRNIIGILF